jgi:hypothetical protein
MTLSVSNPSRRESTGVTYLLIALVWRGRLVAHSVDKAEMCCGNAILEMLISRSLVAIALNGYLNT